MFVLCISVTPPAIDRIKGLLTQSLPDVKSSHRIVSRRSGAGWVFALTRRCELLLKHLRRHSPL